MHLLIRAISGGSEGPDRIFVGGLPHFFTDSQIRELLESFGYASNRFLRYVLLVKYDSDNLLYVSMLTVVTGLYVDLT